MSVLITGGAGYIGAHVVRLLSERGDAVVVVDDLSSGDPARLSGARLEKRDLTTGDARSALAQVMREHQVTRVVHLAARKQAAESVEVPEEYFRDNIGGLAAVIGACADAGVRRLVFSSSAAVYGMPATATVDERTPTLPINPYGESKLVGEWLVRDAVRAHGIDAVSLRYFNVAGAGWPDLGDPHSLNLVTIAIDRIRRGLPPIVYGGDFDTHDGTGVRDYIHVLDLAGAHLAALDALDSAPDSPRARVFNVGTGSGASVLEVLDRLRSVSGIPFEPVVEPRRPGDPDAVVADASRIAEELGWRATRSLDEMITSAWTADRTAQLA
ncbi:UDP-glucose 4-epimerase GalE [Agromyces sp. H3Y2-19a]|uniref:UDP-glucose 4-epimerase GalE n=1 Tax=Agromyces TaxID=33877 RepID=UPI0023B96665|nr:UDP-glucose 4-epimerase GalE [Agromyces chromiiresistens]MDF0514627.1 UDP-glucose 4-epimerase GalE [Agromyces chromiiresistens]